VSVLKGNITKDVASIKMVCNKFYLRNAFRLETPFYSIVQYLGDTSRASPF
jgi:hypothetical protein